MSKWLIQNQLQLRLHNLLNTVIFPSNQRSSSQKQAVCGRSIVSVGGGGQRTTSCLRLQSPLIPDQQSRRLDASCCLSRWTTSGHGRDLLERARGHWTDENTSSVG